MVWPVTQEPQSNPFGEGLSEQAAHRYKRVRPGYPPEAVREIFSCLPRGGRVADLGAGTGQLTRSLIKEGFGVIAVEPSASMRAALTSEPWANTANLEVRPTLAEDTGIEACSVDAVVWADSFHWLNAKEAAGEAGRILKRNGLAFLLANQLDVSKPWVHRLSRIMRSGDVLRNVPPGLLGPQFTKTSEREWKWEQTLLTTDVLELAKTRSSYLRSNQESRKRMQKNLDWYLHSHLGFARAEEVTLPYRTVLSAFALRSD